MRSRNLWIPVLIAVMAVAPAFADRVNFKPLGVDFTPTDMSADGTKMVGFGLGGVAVWTEQDGFTKIGDGGCSGQVKMSFDGSTIVGNERNANNICEAARYDGTPGAWTLMGSEPGGLPCGSLSSSYDTNSDTAVGLFWTAQLCRAIGGTWNLLTGTAGPALPSTVPNRPTRGNAITDDGTIVAGWQDRIDGFRQGARWISGVQELVADDSGTVVGEVIAMNSTGTVMAGTGWQGTVGGTGQGWLWREGQGMIPLGVGGIGRNIQTVPVAVSEDGKTVVGISRDFDNFIQKGWIWTEKKGFELLNDFVKGRQAAGWDIWGGSAMSADGKRIAGYGISPNGFDSFIIDLGATGPQN